MACPTESKDDWAPLDTWLRSLSTHRFTTVSISELATLRPDGPILAENIVRFRILNTYPFSVTCPVLPVQSTFYDSGHLRSGNAHPENNASAYLAVVIWVCRFPATFAHIGVPAIAAARVFGQEV